MRSVASVMTGCDTAVVRRCIQNHVDEMVRAAVHRQKAMLSKTAENLDFPRILVISRVGCPTLSGVAAASCIDKSVSRCADAAGEESSAPVERSCSLVGNSAVSGCDLRTTKVGRFWPMGKDIQIA